MTMTKDLITKNGRNPRILVVTPEITYLPIGMGNMGSYLKAKAGGLADVSAALVAALFELGADVHVAMPHYRRMFSIDVGQLINDELRMYKHRLPDTRIHFAEDRVFYYRNEIYGDFYADNMRIALAFQREVINHVIPEVEPDLIHCNDWMTGLIPAAARRMNIPSLFTLHNIHTQEITLEKIEDSGIDAAEFWRYLYYTRVPAGYCEARETVPIDLLASAIFAAHFINTVSPTFLREIVEGRHSFVPHNIRNEIAQKEQAGCAFGILNAPDPRFDPATDQLICRGFAPETHKEGKLENKRMLQMRLGLEKNDSAPVFFWPSRLDPVQKGCQLLTDILYRTVDRYWSDCLQVVVVANGSYQKYFRDIARFHGIQSRVAVRDFDEQLSHLAYAASDFLLMPSRFEPCGLPQMISCIYGSIPVVHDTGGLHDTVSHISVDGNTGNGFVFETYDSNGLAWAIGEAMAFYHLPEAVKARHISRIMIESVKTFNHAVTAGRYFEMYEDMLKRPIINSF